MGVSTLTSLATGALALGNALGGIALVSPQTTVGYQPSPFDPQTGSPLSQPPALLFHYEGENTSTLESDITDEYDENNQALQNQIALRPVLVTVQGFIGELNNIPPNKALQIAQTAAQKLTVLTGYTPQLSATALIAYNEALFAYQTGANLVNNAVAAFSSIAGGTGSGTSVIGSNGLTSAQNQNKQQMMYQQFFGYWNNRTLFTVQTPWAIFQNMAIKTLKAVQSAETNVISEFEITFKQMRFPQVTTGLYQNNANFAGRLFSQAASLTNLGTSALTPSSTSFSSLLG